MKKLLIILLLSVILKANLYSQDVPEFNCGQTFTGADNGKSFFGGFLKPLRTDSNEIGGITSIAYFPVLIVYVQFKGDINLSEWPTGQSPIYIDSVISETKKTNSDWWNAYDGNKESLTDYWQEVSRGKLHFVGKAFSIVLDSTANYYESLGLANAELTINAEIWRKVDVLLNSDWNAFDRWTKNDTTGIFYYQQDNYVDMIMKIHKSKSGVLAPYDGFAFLSWYNTGKEVFVNSEDSIKINYGYSSKGSGLTIINQTRKISIIDVLGHEYAHYLLSGGHIKYGKLPYGTAGDLFFSPWEMIYSQYMKPIEVNYSSTSEYNLLDFSSRNNNQNGEVLQVPISSSEFFLIANRRKVSNWDRIMYGDTAQGMLDKIIDSNYGKGVYIYHITGGYNFEDGKKLDLECADGLYYWSQNGLRDPKWDLGNANVPYLVRDSVSYLNDDVALSDDSPNPTQTQLYSNKDGKSVNWKRQDGRPLLSWFNIGKKETGYNVDGTARIYTNDENHWTSWEWAGDRWDAWNVGYNEIFSPYSSPNTFSWNNDNTGIFIWYNSLNGDTANLKIYKTSANTPLDSILKWTPPSRPMGIKNTYVPDATLEEIYHPKISWNHNMEPDMARDNGKKMYVVYRALADNMNQLPGPYYVRAALEIDTNAPAEYVDLQIIGEPSYLLGQEGYEPFPLRYRVVAVDKYNDYSVPSDFATAIGIKPEGSSIDPGSGDKIGSNNGLPKEYNLFQNYPNPFNPVTNIQFDLPKEGLVTLKVYDVLGREVKNIVNEFKQAGSYIISFHGSELSSGIYFYRLESGNFVQVRRMVLIK